MNTLWLISVCDWRLRRWSLNPGERSRLQRLLNYLLRRANRDE